MYVYKPNINSSKFYFLGLFGDDSNIRSGRIRSIYWIVIFMVMNVVKKSEYIS